MEDNRWWGWVGLIILFVIFQWVRALFRGVKNAQGGMARLNAAAERILKDRGASVANPIPRTAPAKKKIAGAPATPKERRSPAVPKSSSTPAVIRRGGLLSGGKEPVIQRRR